MPGKARRPKKQRKKSNGETNRLSSERKLGQDGLLFNTFVRTLIYTLSEVQQQLWSSNAYFADEKAEFQ